MGVVNVDDKEKLETLNKYLLDEYVLVHLDPTVDGVAIPKSLQGTPSVTLKLSKLFRGQLRVEKHLVSAELLFGAEYFECKIPLRAIWGMTTAKGKSLMWPTSTPADILQSLLKDLHQDQAPKTGQATADKPTQPAKMQLLRTIDGTAPAPESPSPEKLPTGQSARPKESSRAGETSSDVDNASQGPKAVTAPTKKRGHLRLIK
jgi:hypothetical protein